MLSGLCMSKLHIHKKQNTMHTLVTINRKIGSPPIC